MGRPVRVAALVLVGGLLLQAAWILTLPPFRGTDEFDHAYRAAAVAGGQWRASDEVATDGRGQLVRVPEDIVRAAHPVCASLPYTGRDNCSPVRALGASQVEVASAAATYHPLFYWIVGTAARPFDGAAALYAMRVASAVLCSLFLALAAWVTALWARTVWPLVALVAAVTPVVAFSTAVVAPNGWEMCAALALWTALLGLHSRRGLQEHGTALVLGATAGALVLTTLRSLGPLWLALVLLTTLLPLGRRTRWLAGGRAVLLARCAATVLAATTASVAWTVSAGTNTIEDNPTEVPNRLLGAVDQVPLWVLQSIAAFPRRGNPAPTVVYVLVGLILLILLVAGARAADGAHRVAMGGLVLVAVGVPVALTFVTIRATGPIWQGRYGAPYHLGLFLLAGLALDLARVRLARTTLVLAAGATALGLATTISVLHVLDVEVGSSPLASSPQWVHVPGWAAAALIAAGYLAWFLAPLGSERSASVET